MSAKDSKRLKVQGRGIPLPGDDIDTDRIIPARYLREITFETLGTYAFYDERFDEKGAEMPYPRSDKRERAHPLNDKRFKGGAILIVGRNFGCGSSREHAPQSLMRMGITAFIGESFAEIFSGNCTALGLPGGTRLTRRRPRHLGHGRGRSERRGFDRPGRSEHHHLGTPVFLRHAGLGPTEPPDGRMGHHGRSPVE